MNHEMFIIFQLMLAASKRKLDPHHLFGEKEAMSVMMGYLTRQDL